MSLGKKVFISTFLLLLRKIWSNVINLLVMAFLARMLSKEDFGLLAISSVFLSIINTLATSGIAEYVVYYDGEDKEEKLNAAFWLNLFLTIAVVVVVVTTGPWWADFYENKKVYSLLLLLSVSFFFEMGSTIPKALLRKELEYKTLVYYSTVSMTVISGGKLVAAWAGFGVYSLALPQALVSPFLMVAFFIKTNWKPLATVGYAHYKTIIDYSKHIIGGRLLSKFVNEGDNLIIGKFVGMEGLGVYTLAFQLANLVTTNVVFLVNDLVLPVLSKVKRDLDRLREVYIRMIQLLSLISFPLIVALALAAEPIVMIIYGSKWSDAIIPFQILSFFALGRSLSSPSSSLFSAVGKPKIGLLFTVVVAPIFLLSVWVGSYYGIMGVAIATTLVRSLASVAALLVAAYLVRLSGGQLMDQLKKPFILVIFLAAVFYVMSLVLTPVNSSYVINFIQLLVIPTFIYAFFICLRFWDRQSIERLTESLSHATWSKPLVVVFKRILFL